MRGATLVELVAALGVVGIMLAVVGLGLASLEPPREAELAAEISQARRRAAQTGKVVTVTRAGMTIRFGPDGSAGGGPLLTDSTALFVDPLTGAVRAQAR